MPSAPILRIYVPLVITEPQLGHLILLQGVPRR